MSLIVKIDSKSLPWSQNKRYKVGQSIEHTGSNWVNLTGGNSEPGIGVDWEFVSGTASMTTGKEPLITATAAQASFILSKPANGVVVVIDRVTQIETIDYNFISGGTEVITTFDVDLGSKVDITRI